MVDLVAVHDQALDGLLKGDHGEGGGEDGGQDMDIVQVLVGPWSCFQDHSFNDAELT